MGTVGRRASRVPPRRPRVLLAIAITLGPLLIVAVSPPSIHVGAGGAGFVRTDAGSSIAVSTNNFLFAPNSLGPLPAGPVTITVTQLASNTHTFTLSSLANYTIPAGASNLSTFFTQHPPLVSVTLNATVGEQHTVTFTPPKVGYYEFVCEISGHFQLGMYGFLGYQVAPPNAAPTSTGPGTPVFIIGGVIVGLVVLALALGFVIGRREGSKHEMSPERLGYMEPGAPTTITEGRKD